MDQRKLAKQMIEFYKTTFDNTYAALSMMQEQTERMTSMFLEQAPGMPAEGKKALQDWMKAYRKGCDDFKRTVDDNFKKAENIFSEAEKPAEKPVKNAA